MSGHKLVADRFLHLRTDGKGKVKYKKRYFKNDIIPDLDEAEADRLLQIGAVVLDEADEVEDEDEESDSTDTDDSTESTEVPEDTGHEPVDYESLAYADLQVLAKERDLSAGGSKEDLIVRLVDFDNEHAEQKHAE